MPLDAATLLIAITVVHLAGSLLFFVLWRFYPGKYAKTSASIGLWALTLAALGAGTILVGLRGHVPDMLSIVAANGLVLLGTGLARVAISALLGQPRRIGLAILPTVVWLALCAYPPFLSSVTARLAVVQLGMASCLLWIAFLCFRKNRDKLYTAVLTGIAVLAEASSQVLVVLNTVSSSFSSYIGVLQEDFMKAYLVATLLFTVATIVLAFAMIMERHLSYFRTQARRDPQTGFPNRRMIEDMLLSWHAANTFDHAPFSVASFKIDPLDSLKDKHRPALEKAFRQLLACLSRDEAGPDAIIGCIGDEDLTVIFPNLPIGKAALTAESIRRRFCTESSQATGDRFAATANAGVSGGNMVDTEFQAVLDAAAMALANATLLGTDRLCMAAPEDCGHSDAPVAEDNGGSAPEPDQEALDSQVTASAA